MRILGRHDAHPRSTPRRQNRTAIDEQHAPRRRDPATGWNLSIRHGNTGHPRRRTRRLAVPQHGEHPRRRGNGRLGKCCPQCGMSWSPIRPTSTPYQPAVPARNAKRISASMNCSSRTNSSSRWTQLSPSFKTESLSQNETPPAGTSSETRRKPPYKNRSWTTRPWARQSPRQSPKQELKNIRQQIADAKSSAQPCNCDYDQLLNNIVHEQVGVN